MAQASLAEYRRKRDLSRSAEPGAETGVSPHPGLVFVVQMHQASHLHYDLRLEAQGTLKSWAVPKGPSLDPRRNRLAMMVEDHPLEYAGFEGTIPAGNYGAGTVMVWDRGSYTPARPEPGVSPEAAVARAINNGKLEFFLNGTKLKGEFDLIRTRGRGENAWLLVKKNDEFAVLPGTPGGPGDDRSVATGRSMREIARAAEIPAAAIPAPSVDPARVTGARTAPMPAGVMPMLSTLVERPFDRPGWFFEIKWDGYRAIATVSRSGCGLRSRNGKDISGQFPPVVAALRRFRFEAIIDGEIAVLDHEGKADFQLLQNYLRSGKGLLVYYVFDLLYLNGYDLRGAALRSRKALLARLLSPTAANIKLSGHVETRGKDLFAFAQKEGIEGILAKDGSSVYEEGRRSRRWQKIKAERRQEAVIGGFTSPRGARKLLGSLLLGVYEPGGRLRYIGHSGGGFNDRELDAVHAMLVPLARRTSPFVNLASAQGVTWVEPRLVCEVRFTEWTSEGLMRHPVYLGLRQDKEPWEVTREAPAARPARFLPSATTRPEQETLSIGGVEQKITHLTKLFWPEEGYTKRDLIRYYREAATAILPFLVDRPQSLRRYPDGISGKSFFHKELGRLVPGWIRTFAFTDADGEKTTYMVCRDEASLVYMVNLGCIDINPWNSRTGDPGHPDYAVFDFDPHMVPFSDVLEAVLATHRLLEDIGCASYCKSSGATGMHVYVPLGGRYTHEQARGFAELVNRLVNRMLPSITSLERMPRKREGKVYLDYLQNGLGKTMAAPYSVRPVAHATVSCPLEWAELDKRFDPSAFTIRTMSERLKRRPDPWRGVLGKGIDMRQCLERLARRYGGVG